MAKIALLIGVSEYEPGLTPLPAATKDVEAMQQVLENPDIGGFDEVKVLVNPPRQEMEEAIEMLFDDRQRDDLLLLFFSGHGIKDEEGNLYFATRNTRKNLLQSTTVSAKDVHQVMKNSRSKREVVILDCCFSGAFAEGMLARDDGFVDIKNQLGGEGRAVLTSSTSTQYSFEQQEADTSTYTRYIVEGLETGAADRDEDGWISVDELHEYAKSKVQDATPAMKPEIYAIKEGYKIQLAKAPIDDPKLKYGEEVEYWASAGDGHISEAGRDLLDELRRKLGLTSEETEAIEDQVLEPHREYQRKWKRYKERFIRYIKDEYPINHKTREKLIRFQKVLGFTDEIIALIETSVIQEQEIINLRKEEKRDAVKVNDNINPINKSKKIGYLSIGICFCIIGFGFYKLPVTWIENIINRPNAKKHFSDLSSSSIPSGIFEYDASTSWSPIYPKLETEITRAWTNFKLRKHNENYLDKGDKEVGSTVVIQKLINGKIAFALSSRQVLDTELQQAKRQNFSLIGIPVAKDAIAVAVHPELDIPGLTKENLRSIYTGEIDNWNRFGGPDRKITAYSRNDNSGTTEEFKKILGIQNFGRNITIVNTTTEAIKRVGLLNDGIDKSGIYYASASEIVPQCSIKSLPLSFQNNQSFVFPYVLPLITPSQCGRGNRNQLNFNAFKQGGDYPLTRDLIIVIKKNGSNEEKAGEAYVKLLKTDEGQSRIHDALNKPFVIN